MEKITRALAAATAARAWAALLGIAVVPIYVRLMGLEAYGLVGFFASLQAIAAFLDLGLGPTLTRELARDGGRPQNLGRLRDLLRTFETVYWLVALLLGLALALLGPIFAIHWVKLDTLGSAEAAAALALAAMSLGFQWPAALYASGMAGLHRQVMLGAATAAFATLRVVLSVSTLILISPSLEAFFASQLVGSVAQSLGMRTMLWRHLPSSSHRPKVRVSLLKQVSVFASGMAGIALTSIVLTQSDKLILSHLLPLEDFGIYTLASALALGLYVLIGPFFSVIYPRFSSYIARGHDQRVAEQYHFAGQALAALIIPSALVLAIFSRDVLYVWTGDAILAGRAAPVLSLLVLGNMCNGILNVPYALKLASGRTGTLLRINLVAILFVAPGTWLAASLYGAVGGASIWFALNAVSLVVTPFLLHRKMLREALRSWYLLSTVVPLLIGTLVAGSFGLLRGLPNARLALASELLFAWLMVSVAVILALPHLRRPLVEWRIGFAIKQSKA